MSKFKGHYSFGNQNLTLKTPITVVHRTGLFLITQKNHDYTTTHAFRFPLFLLFNRKMFLSADTKEVP